MKERILAGVYGLSDPRLVATVLVVLTATMVGLALVGALLPAPFGGLLAPASGGTANG